MHKAKAEVQTGIHAILHILEDRYPHSVSGIEIASLLNLSEENVDFLLGFLAKYALIAYDEGEKTAIISADFSTLD
jgi:hypothetical protein